MEGLDVELPYAAEYAKSGRASCKGCKSAIPKDALRLAAMVQVRRYVDYILDALDEKKE